MELNKEYTYQDICSTLGWSYQTSNNETKKKQIRCIEESFKFYHPVNKKTKKEKKSYVFTEIIKEPLLEDGRKNNGGFRETAGRKALLPEEEFDFLWKVVVSRAYDLNAYYERERLNKVYFNNTLLFSEFGFSYSDYLEKAKFEESDNIVKYVFSDTVYEVLKAQTITRLCRRYGFPKNSLPKGILRSRSKQRLKQIISNDKLLKQYNEFEAEALKKVKCNSVVDAVRNNKYADVREYISNEFERIQKYNVQRYNVIQVNDFDVIENGRRFGYENMEQNMLLEQYRKHFREIVFASVEKSIIRRISDEKEYKVKLNAKQKDLLKKYLDNMLGRNEKLIIVEFGEEPDWLKQVV